MPLSWRRMGYTMHFIPLLPSATLGGMRVVSSILRRHGCTLASGHGFGELGHE